MYLIYKSLSNKQNVMTEEEKSVEVKKIKPRLLFDHINLLISRFSEFSDIILLFKI